MALIRLAFSEKVAWKAGWVHTDVCLPQNLTHSKCSKKNRAHWLPLESRDAHQSIEPAHYLSDPPCGLDAMFPLRQRHCGQTLHGTTVGEIFRELTGLEEIIRWPYPETGVLVRKGSIHEFLPRPWKDAAGKKATEEALSRSPP